MEPAISDTRIYVISDGSACKIGIAKHPDDRLAALQGSHPQRLRMVYMSKSLTRGAARRAEAAAHATLNDRTADGGSEWFHVEPETAVLAVEEAVNSAPKKTPKRVLRSRLPDGTVAKRRGRKPKFGAAHKQEVAASMATRDGGATAAEVAAAFGMSRSTAYRAMRVPREPETPVNPRLAELRTLKGRPVAEVIEGETFVMSQRAKDALHAAHAKLANAWRAFYDDKAAAEREREDFTRRVRVRVAKTDGPWYPANFTILRGPLRYNATVTYGPRPAPPAAAPTASVELPPWPLPWETVHPTEAVGQIFRNAMRGKPLPSAAVALGLVDKAMTTLTEFRNLLTEPDPVGTGPPSRAVAEPTPEQTV